MVESISDIVALGLSNNPTRIGFCFSNEFLPNFIEKVVIPNALEEIQIIDEVPFKTQKEVWEFLVSNEGNVVEHTVDGRKLTMVDGRLTAISDALPPSGNYSAINFTVPELWKPSSELYKKQKEWWELNGNKPTLCWYGDVLNSKGKYNYFGVVIRDLNRFRVINESVTWKYAIPLTKEEIEEITFKPLENG